MSHTQHAVLKLSKYFFFYTFFFYNLTFFKLIQILWTTLAKRLYTYFINSSISKLYRP